MKRLSGVFFSVHADRLYALASEAASMYLISPTQAVEKCDELFSYVHDKTLAQDIDWSKIMDYLTPIVRLPQLLDIAERRAAQLGRSKDDLLTDDEVTNILAVWMKSAYSDRHDLSDLKRLVRERRSGSGLTTDEITSFVRRKLSHFDSPSWSQALSLASQCNAETKRALASKFLEIASYNELDALSTAFMNLGAQTKPLIIEAITAATKTGLYERAVRIASTSAFGVNPTHLGEAMIAALKDTPREVQEENDAQASRTETSRGVQREEQKSPTPSPQQHTQPQQSAKATTSVAAAE